MLEAAEALVVAGLVSIEALLFMAVWRLSRWAHRRIDQAFAAFTLRPRATRRLVARITHRGRARFTFVDDSDR